MRKYTVQLSNQPIIVVHVSDIRYHSSPVMIKKDLLAIISLKMYQINIILHQFYKEMAKVMHA